MLEGWIWPPDGWIYVQESWILANAARGCKLEGWIWHVTSYLIGRLDPEIVRNCTNLVRNSFTRRQDLHEFGKELPYGGGWIWKLYEIVRIW